MTIDHRSIETRRQLRAEQMEREGMAPSDDPSVDAYRLVHRVARTAPMPALPNDFASRVARAVHDHDERAHLEIGCVTAAMVLAMVAAALFAGPVFVASVVAMMDSMPAVPWSLLMASALSLLAVACTDRILPGRTLRGT